jgi:hypothetical protein
MSDEKPVIYVNADVEATGPVPGLYSMVSYASVAHHTDGTPISMFYETVNELSGASRDPDTMVWWTKHPEAWATTLVDRQDPADSLFRYAEWIEGLPGNPIFVATPVAFDFGFLAYYLARFAGRNPFGHRGLDIRSQLSGASMTPYADAHVDEWMDPGFGITHHPLDDSKAQASAFFAIARHYGIPL